MLKLMKNSKMFFIVYLRPYQVHPVFRSQRYMQMSNCLCHILYYRRLSLGKCGHSWFDNQDIHDLEKNRKIVHSKIIFKKILHLSTGKSFSEVLILATTNPKYNKRLFPDLPVQYIKIPNLEHGENMGRTCCLHKLF